MSKKAKRTQKPKGAGKPAPKPNTPSSQGGGKKKPKRNRKPHRNDQDGDLPYMALDRIFQLRDQGPEAANKHDMRKVMAMSNTAADSSVHVRWLLKQVLNREPTNEEAEKFKQRLQLLERWGDATPDTDSNLPNIGMHAGTTWYPNPSGFPLSDQMYVHQSLAERAFLAKYPDWYNFVKDNNAQGAGDDPAIDALVETAMEADLLGKPVTPPPAVLGNKASFDKFKPALLAADKVSQAAATGVENATKAQPQNAEAQFWGPVIQSLIQVGVPLIASLAAGA